MDLARGWRAAIADEDTRRHYPEPAFDDVGWEVVDVPGHWRSVPAFASSDGPLLYRVPFSAPAPDQAEGRRAWLTFDGVFYQGDVWLDGSYLGDTEGYFFPHSFEITEALSDRRDHVLATEVNCTPPVDKTAKRAITGVFQHGDCLDPDWNPGGIWRAVRIEETGPVRITRLRVLCPDASPTRAVLTFRMLVDAVATSTVVVRASIDGSQVYAQDHTLAAGENRVEWRVVVEDPRLWWPHALGAAELVDVAVEVGSTDGLASDRRELRTGLRQVRMNNWIATINGERLFLKGANLGPTRMALGEATAAELEADVVAAMEAGLDMVRVHAHVTRPEFYDAADRHGVLLWQDFPLHRGYARSIRKQAIRQAREMVDLLGHHPSVAIWCGHNEPLALAIEPGVDIDLGRTGRRLAAMQELPTWNKTILDGSVHRAIERADPTRPTVPHSGVFPHPGSGGTDTHLYFGWYHGSERDLGKAAARWPRLFRFLSEFGAQAVPESDDFMQPATWPALDWDGLARHHALQRQFFARNGLDPLDFDTFDAWRAATQSHQAEVIRTHIETMRRLKYRPAGGFAQFSFADSMPAVSWSVLDHQRRPKPGFAALAAACAPVILVADRPEATYRPSERIDLDVHVVSDLRVPITDATVRGRLIGRGPPSVWVWNGEVAADGCALVGTIRTRAPAEVGPLVLELTLEGPGIKAANRYESAVLEARM